MAKYIALLRGINIAGHNMVAMADLRKLLTRLGFEDPQSLLQSGNLVFRGRIQSTGKLEQLLEMEVKKRLAVEPRFFVRTAREWQSIIARNPFPGEAERDPSHMVVMFFKDAPEARALKGLQGTIEGSEVIRAEGRQGYVIYPDGFGRSRLTLPLIESKLGTKGTGRNWNTVLKLAAITSDKFIATPRPG
ncbi:MAG TPA: DUF1697 domain-containing protein [Bacteroidota bacterium]